VRQNIDIQK